MGGAGEAVSRMNEYRYSSTETFLVCRRRFMYEYVWEIEPNYLTEKPGTLADVGNAFHAGAQALYSGANCNEAVEQYIREHHLEGQTYKGTDLAYCARGLINRFKNWPGRREFDEGYKTVMLEEKLRLELLSGVFITGIPDRVVEDQFGRLHIIDYKTVGQYRTYAEYMDLNRQGRTYALLVEAATGKHVDSFTLLQVHRKPPKSNPQPVNDLPKWFTEDEKKSHRKQLEQIVTDMVNLAKGDLSVYPHPGDHCGWCPFQKLCYTQDAEKDNFETMKRVEFRKKVVE